MIVVPPTYRMLCQCWNSGQNCSMHAVVCTHGRIIRGEPQPFENGEEFSDAEWYESTLIDLTCDVRAARKAAQIMRHPHAAILLAFEEWCEDQLASLTSVDKKKRA